jgi:light-regulated signal transduction histidine kinase (bacteriophytochrome)
LAVNIANQIAGGERKPEIRVRSKDEVGLLLTALNDMSESLSEADAKVNERNRELSQTIEKVEQRNRQLEDAKTAVLNLVEDLEIAKTGLEEQKSELETARRELERSNGEMQDFTFAVSHDLQEPLRKIHTFSQFLVEDCGEEVSEKGREHIGRMQDASERMSILICNLLALSRIGTRGGNLARVESKSIVNDVLDALSVQLEEAGAEVEAGDLPDVMADRTQLGQLFQNIIGNALKFRRPDETPRVTISSEADGDFVTFRVQDNGIGMEKRFLEKIFTIFQRLHSRDQYEGTGVGLAVCKKIVACHGGKIWAESEPGKGSSFFFTLPKAASTEGSEA